MPNSKLTTDRKFMHQALELAAAGRGYVSPNPLVGCVIVSKAGKVIGTGYHQKYGGAHAEENAIIDAEKKGNDLKNATVYVNLEPCSHQGKRGPCADLLLSKRVGRCIIGMRDPYSEVDGRGIAKLEAAGIDVKVGMLEAESKEINKFFTKYVTTGLPYVTLKMGTSLDGKSALKSGVSQWITSEASRRMVHQMRSEYDAVMVASATVLTDDPELTVRFVDGRSPRRIILDANLRIPESAKVYSDAHASRTIIVTTERTLKEKPELKALLEKRGISFVQAKAESNQFVLRDVFEKLGKMHITSILVEPGPTLATVLLQEDHFDEVVLFVAPMVLGNDARSAFGDLHLKKLQDAHRVRLHSSTIIEDSDDIRIEYRKMPEVKTAQPPL